MNGLVSIIIPVYNTDPALLRRAVASALSQEKVSEIIIIDDGSAHNTADAIDGLAEGSPEKIKALHKANGGASSARNLGLDVATGKYVAFLDADDILADDFCNNAVQILEERSADIVFGAMQYVSLTGGRELRGDSLLSDSVACFGDDGIEAVKASLFNTKAMLRVGLSPVMYVSQCAVLYRHSAIADVRFNEAVKISEDRLFNYDVLANCRRIAITGQVWYYYMANRDSASQKLRITSLEDLLSTATEIEKLKCTDQRLLNDFNLGIIECFQQTLYFTILRTGFSRAAGMSQRAYVERALQEEIYRRAFQDAKYLEKKQQILRFLFLHRMPGCIVVLFHLNKALYDMRKGELFR